MAKKKGKPRGKPGDAERMARMREALAARRRRLAGGDVVTGRGGAGAPPISTWVVATTSGERLFISSNAGQQEDVQRDTFYQEQRLARDPAAWIDENIQESELGKSFTLADYQRRVLSTMFVFDQAGKVAIDEAVWSEPKKSGKTTLAAALALWWADTQEAPNEILVVANDLEQATSRAFATMCTLLKKNPTLGERARRVSNTKIVFDTGTTIRAMASEYAGAAGSNHGLTLWDEIWAGTTENYRRLWDELTPVPTRLNSIRLVFSYAGFEGESKTLRDLYLAGVDAAEHPEGRGERLDDELPIYRSREGAGLNLVTFWSHDCRMPWQTAGWLERQRQDHISKGRVSTWLRLFENRWVSGESAFITAALWDAIVNPDLMPLAPTKSGAPLWVGVDIGIKNDTTGIVAVQPLLRVPEGTPRVRIALHKIWKPKPGTPVDHADIEAYLRYLHSSYKLRKIAVDPHQALDLIVRLKKAGLPIEECPQTSGTVDAMGQTLITAIQARDLVVYPDADLRQQALNTVAVEKPSGMMRMDKAKSNRKIDAIVALALALHSRAAKPEESFHLAWNHTVTTAGKVQAFYAHNAQRRNVDGRGTSYLGDGIFMSRSGEVWKDPRGL